MVPGICGDVQWIGEIPSPGRVVDALFAVMWARTNLKRWISSRRGAIMAGEQKKGSLVTTRSYVTMLHLVSDSKLDSNLPVCH